MPQQPILSTTSELCLKRLLSRALSYGQSHDTAVTMATLRQCSDDLTKLARVEPSLKGCGLFSAQFLHCQLLINKVGGVVAFISGCGLSRFVKLYLVLC